MARAASKQNSRKSVDVRSGGLPAPAAGVLLLVKVVPGSRREEIVGWLGDRLKVKVAAPPEDGRANEALCRLLALHLGLGSRAVVVVSGHSGAEKSVRIEGLTPAALASRLAQVDPDPSKPRNTRSGS